MSAGSVIQEMRDKLKANKDLLRSRKPYEAWKSTTRSKFGEPLKYKEATEAEMRQFRLEHQERMRKFRMLKILAILISLLIVVGIGFVINSIGKAKVNEPKAPTIVYNEDFFLQYIETSNRYLYQGDYENAVLFAHHALKCGVEGWYGEYHLAKTYLSICYETEEFCAEGVQLAMKLQRAHPSNVEIAKLLENEY